MAKGATPTSGRPNRRGEAEGGDVGRPGERERLRQLETRLLAFERRFERAQELAEMGVWEWSLADGSAWWSPGVYRLWGLSPGDRPPPLSERRIHPEDRESYEAACKEATLGGETYVEWRVTLPDGSIRWLCEIGRWEDSGAGPRVVGIVQDITRRKLTETRLTMLLGELQHRVRNILGVVRSLVSRSVRSAETVEELAASLDGRLDTLARTQGVFARSGAGAIDLEDVIRDELVAVAAREEQLEIEGPPVRLRRQAAETLALALHELTINAVKYGALSDPGGRLSVRWRILRTAAGPKLALDWRELGVRALDVAPARSGFGRELIERGLPYDIGAETSLEFAQGGVQAQIEVPLTEKIADLHASTEDSEP
jgi:PAS domain S-box-containing protein